MINLTEEENDLFSKIKLLCKNNNLDIIIRVSGGWIRDKLLGQYASDIDLTIEGNISGVEFAKIIAKSMNINVATIKVNPEKSKHLETSTITMDNFSIDICNLRSESYAINNRIPIVTYGTPKEDAYRRDLTINSLFYNINTNSIEDHTGFGLDDIKNKIIRTPLDSYQTFSDDPLRILRAIRFAAKFNYTLTFDIISAIKNREISDKILTMVSRERIGIEIFKILQFPHNSIIHAFQLITDYNIHKIIFHFDHNKIIDNNGEINVSSCLDSLIRTANYLKLINYQSSYLFLASYLLPLIIYNYRDGKSDTNIIYHIGGGGLIAPRVLLFFLLNQILLNTSICII